MKIGDKCVQKSDVLTILEIHSKDVKTGLVVCVCKDFSGDIIKIPESELLLIDEIPENPTVKLDNELIIDEKVQDSKTNLSK